VLSCEPPACGTQEGLLEAAGPLVATLLGAGRVSLAAPLLRTVVGTETYNDELW
jgi:hypothetical protein